MLEAEPAAGPGLERGNSFIAMSGSELAPMSSMQLPGPVVVAGVGVSVLTMPLGLYWQSWLPFEREVYSNRYIIGYITKATITTATTRSR